MVSAPPVEDSSGQVVTSYSHPRCFIGTPRPVSKGGLDVDKTAACLARYDLHQSVTYQPARYYWPLQWYETGIFLDAPGTILRTRTIAFAGSGATTPMKTVQLLYVTTDELGCRTVSVVTAFQPLGEPAPTPTRLFSYQTSYDALGAQCDPSYTLEAGTEGETGFIRDNVAAGYTVVMADYEGEGAAYGVGQLSGYETLDAIRATERWLGVPEVSTPVGMLGYSGGAVATEFASELAPTYAPHLDIVGVAEGGIPIDLFHELAYIDKPDSSWTGQIPSYLDGLARGFDIRDLNKYFTPQGIAAANADQTQC